MTQPGHYQEHPTMNTLLALVREDAGFVVSAELVLIATIAVLSLVVGLSEVSNAVNQELEDVGSAFGSMNQSYCVQGLKGCKAHTPGGMFQDDYDDCDQACDIQANAPKNEGW